MHDYQKISGLESILLEESYVLDVEAHPAAVEFKMDLVLTQTHPQYTPPLPDETYCYRRGRIRFLDVAECSWTNQGAPPAKDATGEIDYGNIDSFEWNSDSYRLEGDWGCMNLNAARIVVELE